jgi:D-amino-acid dehydrogenase
MMDLSGVGARLKPRRLEVLRRGASRYLGEAWQQGDGERAWIGLRPMTPDGLPAIGRAPGISNLYVATGHGMLGVTLAPVTARAIAELICNEQAGPGLQAFDPGRFG